MSEWQRMNTILREDVVSILSADLQWDFFDGATVFISGAAGLLPAYMVDTLMAMREHKGFGPRKIWGLVRNLEKAQTRFAHWQGRSELDLLRGDVVAPPVMQDAVDVVIHAASIASTQQMLAQPADTLAANVLGTYQMLELAKAKKSKRFLFFSSGEVCGAPQAHQIPMREEVYGAVDPADARSCYAEGKRVSETMCAAWAQQYGVETRIVRPFHTYGPGIDLRGGWVHTDFMCDIIARRDLFIKSDGLATRSFCYVADACEAYFFVMLKGQNALPYNVGTGVETSIRDLAETLVDEYPELGLSVHVQPPDVAAIRPTKRSVPDISRLKSLGWLPKTALAQGFRRTIDSVQWRSAERFIESP